MFEQTLDLSPLRDQFPALQEVDEHGRPFVYFDGPGGAQTPRSVIEAMADYLTRTNANKGGLYTTGQRSDEIINQTRLAMADFLNAASPQEIIFGANTSSLTYNFSCSIGRLLQPGDEIVVTRLDHDANITPWLALEDWGAEIKWVDFDVKDCRLDLEHLALLLTDKTRLVAVGYASDLVGTINPIGRIAALARNVGAWLWVDAAHYAPHGPINVQSLGCDFLVCSAYKFFGPHVGVLWGRLELLEALQPYPIRSTNLKPSDKFELGAQNHEGIAGIGAAVDYLAKIGREYGDGFAADLTQYVGRRKELKQALKCITAYERPLLAYLLAGLQKISGLTIYGITNPEQLNERCPTIAFTKAGFTPQEIAAYLGQQGIFVWNGNCYTQSVTERLGVEASGGLVRVGLVHYNTLTEVNRLLAALRELSKK